MQEGCSLLIIQYLESNPTYIMFQMTAYAGNVCKRFVIILPVLASFPGPFLFLIMFAGT